jgi:hypothetical protein
LEKNLNLSPGKPFPPSQEEKEILDKVLEAVRQIKFGYIQITIQDGRVVQIDRTEKQRFTDH